MAKRKPPTIAKEIEKTAVLLQRLVRLKASDENGYVQCVTCDKIDHFQNMQGGHFIPRNRRRLTLFEENIHPQCPHCNCWGMKQAHYVLKYREYMVDNYGERRVKAMEKLAWLPPKKFDRDELKAMQRDLRDQISEQEARIGHY
tara:strand:- start:8138 stop:8569 length:432 start_codon:yes stop_codon:yes gene_type:complete